MPQWLRALVALAEDPSSVPSICMATTPIVTPVLGVLFWIEGTSYAHSMYAGHIHMCREALTYIK